MMAHHIEAGPPQGADGGQVQMRHHVPDRLQVIYGQIIRHASPDRIIGGRDAAVPGRSMGCIRLLYDLWLRVCAHDLVGKTPVPCRFRLLA